MRYYKSQSGEVFAYSEIQTVPDGMIPLTDAEIESHLNPPVSAVGLRAKRNGLLFASDWIVTRSLETGDAVPPDWLTYRQALRDVPEQAGFPQTIEWPTAPQPV